MSKPIIGISCGDTNGVGPEIIISSLKEKLFTDICKPVIFGPSKVFNTIKKSLELNDFNYQIINSIDQINSKKVNFFNCNDNENHEFGNPTKESGQNAKDALIISGKFLIDGKIDGLVTAPIDKNNIQDDDFDYPGHTEFLNSLDPNSDGIMIMVNQGLRVAMYSGHIPLSEVSSNLNQEKLTKKIKTLQQILIQDFGIRKPNIAVLGLNPHAGDNGLLGKEDQEIIKPVIENFINEGNLVYGPFPADGFFGSNNYKKFDAILAIYHDQGLIPFKALSFGCGTNFTAGLNFVRTSPDHGTAFDIAGKNQASNQSFIQAIYTCLDIIKARTNHLELNTNPLKIKNKSQQRKSNRV